MPEPRAVGGGRKRALDLALGLPALVLAAPVIAAAGLAVRLTSPGPALYRQRRVGLGGRVFTVLKLRTMVDGAERLGRGIEVDPGDPRITRVGAWLRRTSLDELPQLWNVVRGEMSLVGPRPTVPAQVERYGPLERRRLLALPGVTGLAQVSGRAGIPWSQRIALDVRYVEAWSLRLDLAILARTVPLVARGGGSAPASGDAQFDLP